MTGAAVLAAVTVAALTGMAGLWASRAAEAGLTVLFVLCWFAGTFLMAGGFAFALSLLIAGGALVCLAALAAFGWVLGQVLHHVPPETAALYRGLMFDIY